MGYSYSVCQCNDCLKMDLSDRNRYDNNEAYCNVYHRYININDRACCYEHFIYDENRRNNTSSGCYITTTMCNVLGFDDNCDYLNKLRNFRENYIKQDINLYPILFEYDIIGPSISKSIYNDPKKKKVCLCLFKNYIIPIVNLIDTSEYNDAICKYQEMTNNLKILYGLNMEVKEYNYNIKTLGKART